MHRPVRRVTQLYAGLVLYGASMALQVRAGLGLDPWDVFHQGVANRTGLSFGTVVILTGAVVLLAWIPPRQRPGFGTISNVFVIGIAVDATLGVLPHDAARRSRWRCCSPASASTPSPAAPTSARARPRPARWPHDRTRAPHGPVDPR